ncbi:hypothetical protein L873DRAFT_1235240 [Choiromyces venosus 120613-1]|uniref:Uncharacterized protein n=1 Tax=Choiromyces venosus 120613-1 TaxID=1336337 RepID=A0A3N4IRK8_9PEZI|nr:hypothetical protein L873DRAFT_1235240 [Choiromyces venosus 120613-1]
MLNSELPHTRWLLLHLSIYPCRSARMQKYSLHHTEPLSLYEQASPFIFIMISQRAVLICFAAIMIPSLRFHLYPNSTTCSDRRGAKIM